MSTKFDSRSIEIHDTAVIWNPEKIKKIVDFMVRHDLNTLIFHENDIVDKLVYPALLYGKEFQDKNIYNIYEKIYVSIYDKTPSPFVFIDEKPILVELMRSIIRYAVHSGIQVFLQTKEIWHADLIYGSEHMIDNAVCPSDPFWWDTYLPAKYEELFVVLPELSGIVTSTGTRESRASLAHGKCRCERCQRTDLQKWQENIIMSIYKPVRLAGKQLVVRDFTYYADEQNGLKAGMLNLPDDIIISIKNTPQDFYPTFPDNRLIGHVNDREQWIEYDVMGEYFGFGVAPCIMIQDIRKRMKYALANGAKGFTARVDWEALPNHSAFDTINEINVYAVALLSQNTDRPTEDIYKAYLLENNLFKSGLDNEQQDKCVRSLMELLEPTWSIMAKTAYIADFLFSSNSKIPADVEHGKFLALEHHGLQKWFPARKHDHDMTDENIKMFMQEKNQALTEVMALFNLITFDNPGLTSEYYKKIISQFEIFKLYVEQFRAIANVYILASAISSSNRSAALHNALEELRRLENRIKNYQFPVYEYPASVLVCYEKVHYFRKDAEKYLNLQNAH